MPGTQEEAKFHFVDWSDVTGPNKNSATRVFIRKQAMSKAAAARKKRGNWGKNNLGQSIVILPAAQQSSEDEPSEVSKYGVDGGLLSPPSSISSSSSSESGAEHAPLTENLGRDGIATGQERALIYSNIILSNVPSTGYERLRMQYNFDILDLSALTTFHVGRTTTEGLYALPLRLIDVLQCRQWSYFSYIPSRYGHFPCLDDAARCVTSRVRRWMEGDVSTNTTALSLYTRALNSLQAAINDPVLCMKPETLCATEMLSIYELLDNTRSQGWAQHAAGAKSLVKLRGPQRFQTSFEKALFMAQIGPIYTESLIENHDCFLQDPDWQSVLGSVVHEHPVTVSPFSDRGTIVVSLWSNLVCLPSLFKDVQEAVCSSEFISTFDLSSLQTRVTDLDTMLSHWRSMYEPLLLSIPDLSSSDAKAEKRFETLGTCLTCLIILKRLAVALGPLASSASELEMEAQGLADRTMELEQQAVIANPRAGLFMRFKKVVARATLYTADEWRTASLVDARVGANGLIAKWVFERWCNLKGRKV